MTSQKSSLSTFSFTFWSALKGNFVLPLLNLIAITAIVPVSSIIAIRSYTAYTNDPKTGAVQETADKITDLCKYLIFNEFGQVTGNVFLHLAVIAFSILLGVVMFRFIANKKTVNVFYSLGITRKNLFVSKYLAGILMLAVSIAIPFIACLIVNISIFGSSAELWFAIIYHILGYCALSLTAFSLTAAVFSCVGTIVEGITFSGILMLGPTMMFYGIEFLMKKLTLGSPYGLYDANYQMTSLAHTLSRFNPILFLFNNVVKIGMLTRNSKESKYIWEAPAYTDTIIWFIAAAALFLLGIYLFQKRKAEICGFLGVNRWLNFGITFLIGFFPLTIAVTAIESVLAGVLLGMGIFVLLYLIIDFALIRNWKEWAKGLYKLPVHLGISLMVVLVFATGLFGYSTRIPRIENIESAEITPLANTAAVSPYGSGGYSDGDFLFSYGTQIPVAGFKSAKDLETITGLHKQIVDAGKLKVSEIGTKLPAAEQIASAAIRISYHLKNGKTVNRFYGTAKMATITAMLAIDETDRYKEFIKQNLTEPISDRDSAEVQGYKSVFQDEISVISILPNRLNTANQIELTPEMRIELLSAIAEDLTSLPVKALFFPETPELGAIRFSLSGLNPKDEFAYMPEVTGIISTLSLADYNATSIVVTNNMTNTLNFLRANGFMNLFENSTDSAFIAAQVISASLSENNSSLIGYGGNLSFHFLGGWNSTLNDYGSFGGAYKITDKALINKIAANAHISYFNSVDGYFVKFEIKNNGGYTTLYVPASKMPQSVIEAVAVFVQVPPEYPMEKYAY